MSALDRNPDSINFLPPNGFRMVLSRAKNMTYFVQTLVSPGIQVGVVEIPTPFKKLYQPGDGVEYNILQVTFRVDEDLHTWTELHNWIRGIGRATNFDEYVKIAKEGVTQDVDILVMNSASKVKKRFTYKDAFPIYLSQLQFTTTDQTVEYVTATVSFVYDYYDVTDN